MKIRREVSLAAAAFIAGSLATPILYIVSAYITPQGFADLRHASAETVLYYFAIAWGTSALFTVVVGGATWWLLHRRGWDGFVSYALIAGGIALIASAVVGSGMQNWEIVVMAASNGVAVRVVERALR
jgi:hypothetical protein